MSNLTRGCFCPVIRNKGESNLTHCCSILQDQWSGVDVELMWSGFRVDVEWISSGCQVVFELMSNGCRVDVEWMLSGC